MPVEDVLRMVGARPGQATRRSRPDDAKDGQPGPRATTSATGDRAFGPTDEPPPYTADDIPADVAFDGAGASPTAPPPEPERRFDATASTDWRETLRNAGAAHPGKSLPEASTSSARSVPPAINSPAGPASSAGGAAPVSPLPTWLQALELPAGLEAGRLRVAEVAPDIAALPSLDDIARRVAACTACTLHASARNAVPGEGNPQADFLCVGEAPGANEDAEGRPFVGDAGQLLTKILGAIQLTRNEVYICNVIKHRPPGNRDPLPDEVLACQPYLLRQIELVQPKVILALGRFAAQTLLQTSTAISALRGKIHRFHDIPLIVTYHPAALLRNESWKRPTWEDVKLARRILDAARAAQRGAE